LLAVVPESRALAGQGVLRDLPPPVAETFRSLRASLRYFNTAGPIRSLLVMSPQASEGKSTVAWYLACAAAEVGTSTLLIEADLRRPGLRQRVPSADSNGPVPRAGLSSVISGQLSLEDAIEEVDPQGAPFSLLASGPVPPNPTDLLASDEMDRLLAHAQDTYELVIVDSPPVLVVADTIPLLQRVNGVLLVLRLGVTDKRRLRTLLTMTENLQATVLGHVVNGVSGRTGDYGGYYSYYDSLPSPAADPSGLAPRPRA
jgi:non-specific protein-tyrosine kinase